MGAWWWGFALCASAAMRERRPPAAAPARCKLVLVGDVQCGKTAMLQVLAKDCYPEVSRLRYRVWVPGAPGADRVGAVADVRAHRVRELHGVSGQRGAARGAEPLGHLRYRGGSVPWGAAPVLGGGGRRRKFGTGWGSSGTGMGGGGERGAVLVREADFWGRQFGVLGMGGREGGLPVELCTGGAAVGFGGGAQG